MLEIKKEYGYRPALQAHDEIVYVVKESLAEEMLECFIEAMCNSSKWAPNLPLAAEGAYGATYGDCK
jgi:DNA polymerase I-like protein with 3'-5' exonuclease and polymerase domains